MANGPSISKLLVPRPLPPAAANAGSGTRQPSTPAIGYKRRKVAQTGFPVKNNSAQFSRKWSGPAPGPAGKAALGGWRLTFGAAAAYMDVFPRPL